jgi:hypothetical protein
VGWSRIVGWFLVAAGMVGFATVADDLRHVGEILGVGSALVIGLLLVVAGSTSSRAKRAAAWCAAAALGLGAAIGAESDNMPVGVGGGLTVSLVIAVLVGRQTRAPQ